MVRILKVKELEERKRVLLARSEMYRQTLKLQTANINYSAALWKRKFNFLRRASQLLGLSAPLVGLLFFRRKPKPARTGNGLLSKLFAGFKLLGQLRPFLRRYQRTKQHEPGRKNFALFS